MPSGLVRVAFAATTTTLTPMVIRSGTQLVVSDGFAYLHSARTTVVVDPYGTATAVGGWLAGSSRLFPDEDDQAVWGMRGDSVGLVHVGTDEPFASFELPATTVVGDAAPLGNGDIAAPGAGGTYDVNSSHIARRVTAGRLIATGDTVALAQQCDTVDGCSLLRVGTAPPTPAHRLPGTFASLAGSRAQGTVSPDGRVVAIDVADGDRATSLHLVNMNDGRNVDTHLATAAPVDGNEVAVWSPDGRYLWTVTSGGALDVVDARTGLLAPESAKLGLRGRAEALAFAFG